MPETANVEILIEAITEAAESALDDVGDEMTGLVDDAAPADAAARELGNAMDTLEDRADDAGDEIAEAGSKASRTSGLFSTLTLSTSGLSASFGILSTAMTASLIPSILTLSTILLPLASVFGAAAAAAGSLAVVFGGLAATGVVTHMSELKEALADARQAILEIIRPLGEVFGPLLVDAVEALPELVRRIVDSLGPLDQFAETLRVLGAEAMDVIPGMTAVMFDLAEAALPVVIDILRELQQTGPGVMDAVGEAVDRLGGPLLALGSAFADLLPTLHRVGIIAGEMVIPALTGIVNAVDGVAEFILNLEDSLTRLSIAGAITAPAVFGVASAIGSLTGPLGIAAAAVVAFVAAYRSNFMGIQDITDEVIGEAVDLFGELAAKAKPVVADIADGLTSLKGSLQSAFSGGVAAAVSRLATNVSGLGRQFLNLVVDVGNQLLPVFDIIISTLRANSDQFATFATMVVNAVNSIVTGIRTVLLPAVRFVLSNFVIPLVKRLATVWSENFGEILSETIETINALQSYIQPALSALEDIWERHGDSIKKTVLFAFGIIKLAISTVLDAIYTTIQVILNLIQGDWEEAFGAIKDFADDTFQDIEDFVEDWKLGEKILNVLASVAGFFYDLFTKSLPAIVVDGMAWLIGHITAAMNTVYNVMADIWNGIIQLGTDAVEGLINSTVRALNKFLSTLDDVADSVSEIPGVSDTNIGQLETVNLDSAALETERRSTDAAQLTQQAEGNINTAVSLTIKGSGKLAELIREETEAKVEQKEREKQREINRQTATQ